MISFHQWAWELMAIFVLHGQTYDDQSISSDPSSWQVNYKHKFR